MRAISLQCYRIAAIRNQDQNIKNVYFSVIEVSQEIRRVAKTLQLESQQLKQKSEQIISKSRQIKLQSRELKDCCCQSKLSHH